MKSQQKYLNFVYFGNYLVRISISIGTSAKCISYTVMLLKADTLFFKTKVIYSLDMLSSFILCCFCEIVFYGVQKLKGKRVFWKIEIIRMWHIVSSVAQKQNSVDFSNSNCKLAMLSKVFYQKSGLARHQVIQIFKN